MINVDIRTLIEKDGMAISRYALVSGVAKRAQEISKEAQLENANEAKAENEIKNVNDTKYPPVTKSVTEAVVELQKGYYEILMPDKNDSSDASLNENNEETVDAY